MTSRNDMNAECHVHGVRRRYAHAPLTVAAIKKSASIHVSNVLKCASSVHPRQNIHTGKTKIKMSAMEKDLTNGESLFICAYLQLDDLKS